MLSIAKTPSHNPSSNWSALPPSTLLTLPSAPGIHQSHRGSVIQNLLEGGGSDPLRVPLAALQQCQAMEGAGGGGRGSVTDQGDPLGQRGGVSRGRESHLCQNGEKDAAKSVPNCVRYPPHPSLSPHLGRPNLLMIAPPTPPCRPACLCKSSL
jgi:hypothetical protein